MESSFVYDFPKPRMLLWQSKFSDSCMIPCSSCVLKNIDHGCVEEVNDLWSTFPLWRDYGYSRGSYSLLSIPVLTLVSALNIQHVGTWDRNQNCKSLIRNIALKTFRRSIKMVWNSLLRLLKKIFLFLLHQLFFLLSHPNNK